MAAGVFAWNMAINWASARNYRTFSKKFVFFNFRLKFQLFHFFRNCSIITGWESGCGSVCMECCFGSVCMEIFHLRWSSLYIIYLRIPLFNWEQSAANSLYDIYISESAICKLEPNGNLFKFPILNWLTELAILLNLNLITYN